MAVNQSGFSSQGRPDTTNWEEHGAVGDVETGRRFKYVQDAPLKVIIDEVDENTQYFGYTKPGTATSQNMWRIIKMVKTGNVTEQTFADGDDLYNNVWDNRASLSYS